MRFSICTNTWCFLLAPMLLPTERLLIVLEVEGRYDSLQALWLQQYAGQCRAPCWCPAVSSNTHERKQARGGKYRQLSAAQYWSRGIVVQKASLCSLYGGLGTVLGTAHLSWILLQVKYYHTWLLHPNIAIQKKQLIYSADLLENSYVFCQSCISLTKGGWQGWFHPVT